MPAMWNGLSIDVEDAFHASAFEKEAPPETWTGLEQRAAANVDRLLELCERRQVRGTFFILGWIAEHHPQVVKRIQSAGHEIACHGYAHRRIYHQSPDVFRQDISRARKLLEDLAGVAIQGYRAPTYSITPQTLWALDILLEEGFSYDSSIFPVRHDRYGYPGAPRFPYVIRRPSGATLLELPPTTFRVGGVNIPMAGGGYFRLYPLSVTRAAIYWLNRHERQAALIYLHPWEIDPDQPRLAHHPVKWWRHIVNSGKTLDRLDHVLREFRFVPFSRLIQSMTDLATVDLGAELHHSGAEQEKGGEYGQRPNAP